MLTDVEPVPPCRVLVANGQPVTGELWITERPRLVVDYRCTDDLIAPPDLKRPEPTKTWVRRVPQKALDIARIIKLRSAGATYETIGKEMDCSGVLIMTRLRQYAKDHPEYAPCELTRSPSARMDNVTVERIQELQAQGFEGSEIAEQLKCSRDLVYKRLRDFRQSTPERAAEDAALRVCQCGKRKWAAKKVCRDCGRKGVIAANPEWGETQQEAERRTHSRRDA